MDERIRKSVRIALKSLSAILIVLFGLIAVIFNFVITSEKLTPMVTQIANHTLKAKLEIGCVELNFFSSFPDLELELKDGTLVSKVLRDSLWQNTDSLVSFKQCQVAVNPLDYLFRNKINIKHIGLDSASVYAHVSKDGRPNWDIALSESSAESDTTHADLNISEIAVDRILLTHSNIIFDDRNTRIYARVDDVDLDLFASLRKDISTLELSFQNKNILFRQNGEYLVNHVSTNLNTEMNVDWAKGLLTLEHTQLDVNGIKLDVEGSVRRDLVNKAADVDLRYRLHTPSLETVLRMIPESIVQKGSVDAKGEVLLEGSLKGLYGAKHMPKVSLMAKIKNASAHYKDMPYGIDDMELDLNSYIDFMRDTTSFADLRIFRFEGVHTHILAEAKIEDLLGDPYIKVKSKSNIDLTSLAQTFPLQKGVTIQGGVDADVDLQCRLSTLKKQDIGRVRLNGKVDMKNMAVIDSIHHFKFTGNATLDFKGKEKLEALLNVNEINLLSDDFTSSIKNMKATVNSTNPKDTTRIVDVQCQVEFNELKGYYKDSIAVYGRKTKAKAFLKPSKDNKLLPAVKFSMNMDTLFFAMSRIRMGMDKGGFSMEAVKSADSTWIPNGIIGFNHLMVGVKSMKLPAHIRKSVITVNDRQIKLKNTRMTIGASDLEATGAIYDLYHSLKNNGVIKAKLDLTSQNLDCNQIINSLNSFEDDSVLLINEKIEIAEDTLISSEAPMELFVIPENVDFELQTDLKKVSYGNMLFEDVHGEVNVRNQAVFLKDLHMRGLEAGINATLVYQAKNKSKGFTGFKFNLDRINIGKLVTFIPALDTIVPMLRSFKGIVDFEAAAAANLDSLLNIQIPTLKAAVNIKGDSLVLMDGETFAEISKMMMFKNKKRNMIDSIYVNMTVQEGNVTIYPFVVQIDRYKAAVGGTQGLDMNFNYHISVLKSPVPFKLGVNISGNLDKMKFRIGKAKYKDMVTPVAIRKVDSTRVNLGQNIVNDFEGIIRQVKK